MKWETTTILCCVITLVLLGVLMVYSVTAVQPKLQHLFSRHVQFAMLGVAVMFLAARFDYRRLAEPLTYRILAGAVLALLVLVLFFGRESGGGTRWLFGFQPSELAKIALVVLLAAKLTVNREQAGEFLRGYVPPVLITCLFAGLIILERDLGLPVVLCGAAGVVMCVAGVRWRYLFASLMAGASAVALFIATTPYRSERWEAYINPWEHRKEAGWQLIQSLSAFAQGGVAGRGAGAGEQKLGYLPAAHTDFIFSIIGEELGLVGTLATVALFMMLVFVLFRVAMNARDQFGALLVTGIAALIAVQALFIMGVTTGLLPTKGLPLPFVSSGGTALIVYLGLIGIALNVALQSGEARRPARGAAALQTVRA